MTARPKREIPAFSKKIRRDFQRNSLSAPKVNNAEKITAILTKTEGFLKPRFFFSALAVLAACGPPPREVPPVVDLRVCVQTEQEIEAYRPHFKAPVAAEPKGGRMCDAVVRAEDRDGGRVTVRSAYDESVLAEILGPLDLAPRLVKAALAPGTLAYERVTAQRAEAEIGSSPR